MHVHARTWVPLDDTHTMLIDVFWKQAIAQHHGLFGRWRLAQNASNDWGMDREAQRSGAIYSGIDGIHLQDQAVTESMGPIVDHRFEHLAPSDQMITRTRRRLLCAAHDLKDTGAPPPGVDDPEALWEARSGYFVTDDEAA